MSRAQLRRICHAAERLVKRWEHDFQDVDRVELFHFFRGALTPPEENLRQLTACAKFYNSFGSSKKRKSRLLR